MPAFQYAALDSRGRTRKGLLEGETPRHVRQLLRSQDLVPLEVEQVAGDQPRAITSSTSNRAANLATVGSEPGERNVPERRLRGKAVRVSPTELALMTRQLATLIGAGLPLAQALSAVGEHTDNARLKGLWLALRARVLEGHSLATALADYPRAFPDMVRATVAAGEQSGHLEVVLERLADYAEQRQQLRQKTLLALIYPMLLTVVAVAIIIGLLTYVVPQVVDVFVSMNQALPFLTVALLGVSEFIRTYAWWLVGSSVTLVGLIGYAMRNPLVRAHWQRFQLRLPLLGRLVRGINSARFARTFSILLSSGVPVLDSLRISAQVVAVLPMRNAVERAAELVKEGSALSQALATSGYFPPLTVQLIASGEAGGRLEAMLDQAAHQQERESETLIAVLLGLFEPILILLMGGFVLLIVLAVLLPIFDLNQMVR